jgi:hypothetical protein
MPQEKEQDLAKLILQIVDGNSGGIKLIALITALIERDARCKAFTDAKQFQDLVFSTVEATPELDILEYSMVLGDNLFREKMFIYRQAPTGETHNDT